MVSFYPCFTFVDQVSQIVQIQMTCQIIAPMLSLLLCHPHLVHLLI